MRGYSSGGTKGSLDWCEMRRRYRDMEHKSTPHVHVDDTLYDGGWYQGLVEDMAGVCMLGTLRMSKRRA